MSRLDTRQNNRIYTSMKKTWTGSIAFTWWGTWGHVQPIVSLIEYAKNHSELELDCKQLYRFGEAWWQEEYACFTCAWVAFVPVLSGKIRRDRSFSSVYKNVYDMFCVLTGIVQCCFLLKKYRIGKVFCKWWYVALPVCIASWILRIPIVLHESDMHAWLVNRIVSKIALHRCVWFAWMFPQEKVTWQILSDRLLSYTHPPIQEKTQVLVMWWSQWASSLFDVVIDIRASWNYDMTFHVLLGTKNQAYASVFSQHDQVITYTFLDQTSLASVYALCDVSLTRGSATSLAEQQLFGIKKIIVPLPWTWWNHQFYNALEFVSSYDDILVEQNQYMSDALHTFLNKLMWYKKEFTWVDQSHLSHAKKVIRSLLLE